MLIKTDFPTFIDLSIDHFEIIPLNDNYAPVIKILFTVHVM